MSTTTTSQQTALTEFVPEPSSLGFEPDEAFDELVLDEPDVCNSCFAVIKRDHRRVGAGQSGHDEVEHGETGARLRFNTDNEDDDGMEDLVLEATGTHGELSTYPPRTVCGECGAIAGRSPSETLSRREALARVSTLARRLEEHGLLVCERAMRTAVRHGKSLDEHAGKDMDIFRAAAALGIKHGRGLASR
ncbi:hypothetical protein G9C85_02730 [Halorubellus sp. JP-L1]|uniref:hypothetical protein n=1 Tax=Halorubellus sp. JP-L1 TaxID=2715753 RepID=UPI00140B4962|nr:hypothetical protein [Halorubellus sp. JP-L1]NHN40553.1 hypothetical protein [Halorubellus sp. JP-L1]